MIDPDDEFAVSLVCREMRDAVVVSAVMLRGEDAHSSILRVADDGTLAVGRCVRRASERVACSRGGLAQRGQVGKGSLVAHDRLPLG
jgi:hypothetical protein